MRTAAEAADELAAFGQFLGALAAQRYFGDHVCLAAQPDEPNGSVEDLVERGINTGAAITARWAEQIADAVSDRSTVGAIETALGGLRFELEPFAELVQQEMLRGAMLGALDSEWERTHGEEVAAAKFAVETREGAFSSLPFADSVRLFQNRQVLPRAAFDRLEDGTRRAAFTVARMASAEMLNVTKAELARVLNDARRHPEVGEDGVARRPGANLREFRRFARERLESAGWTPANRSHVETIFRTNVVGAHATGRFVEMRKPDVLRALPLWQIRGVNDSRVRPTHKAAFGIVLPANHPFWLKAYPPFGYNCRCRVIARTLAWLKRQGLSIGPVPVGLPDPGFDSGTRTLMQVPDDLLAPPAAPPGPPPTPPGRPPLPPPLPPAPPTPASFPVDPLAEAGRRRREELEELARRERELAEASEREREREAQAAAKASANPMVSKAKSYATALAGPNTRARGMVRKQVETVLPGVKSQDVKQKRSARAKMLARPTEYFRTAGNAQALAWHNMRTGEVVVRDGVRDGAVRALGFLERGLYSDPRLATSTFAPGDAYLAKFGGGRGAAPDPVGDLDHLSSLLHEEIHGYSRSKGYRGIGAMLEEVGTELNARHIVKNLTPEIAANPVLARRFGSQAIPGTAAYQGYINTVCDVVARHAGVSREAAGELVRKAHTKGICSGGPEIQTPRDHVRAFVGALDVPPERAQLIEQELLSI